MALSERLGEHRRVRRVQRLPQSENERIAGRLSGQRITAVWYFLLPPAGDQQMEEWDCGVWHQPTMGIEIRTSSSETVTATWRQYGEWGFGVDLIDGPAAEHLGDEVAQTATAVSEHPAWAQIIGRPVTARFMWNDFGTDRPPCPEALSLATSAGSAWIITAGWGRQQSKLSIQLGTDDLMVIFNEKFLRALGYHDPARGRAEPGTAPNM